MKIIGIIPARYQSSRFPGKALADVNGKSMIQRVYEQASKAISLSKVVVATDDERIEQHVKGFGGEVVITSANHKCGTDRCYEAVNKLNADDWDVVVNIQGDEPFIHPEQIDELAGCFNSPTPALPEGRERQRAENPAHPRSFPPSGGEEVHTLIATLIKRINTTEELFNPNIPKVLINKNKEAIYFSRTPLPFIKSKEHSEWLKSYDYYKHIGIYGYRVDVLQQIVRLEQSPLEIAESLEQLRWIENGFKITTAVTDYESKGIDIPEDLI